MSPKDQDQQRRNVGNSDTAGCPTATPGPRDASGNCPPITGPGEAAPGDERAGLKPGTANTPGGALNTGPTAAGQGMGSNQ